MRICPERDALCPHGMSCPFTVDRYTCNESQAMDSRDADPFARDRERAAKARAATVLHSAADIIGGDRAEQHGPMAVSFGRIAMMWDAYLQVRRDVDEPLTGEDVAHMMVLMKQVRSQSGEWNLDDFVDLCGYGA
jgi:hypothetical protein